MIPGYFHRLFLVKIILIFSLLFLIACAANRKTGKPMTLNYFEYNRGKSFPTRSDIGIRYGDSDYTFHHVYLEDESFFPDNSIIPNAFLSPLFDLKLLSAADAFTEPYYNMRLLHFFKKKPRFGVGIELLHLKVFLINKDQRVHMSGTYKGSPVDREVRIGDYLDLFNVSHGVNHVSLLFNYRWMLSKTPHITDGRFQPFVSISAGPAAPHLELNLKDGDNVEKKAYSYQWGRHNWGMGMGFGTRYKPNRHFGLYFQYRLTYSHLHGMYFDNAPGTTRVRMDFFAHHLQWGISIML
ncbi:MAG: hypothetical protein KAT34_07440 [Candidatus Aminicenantes bacterium]|nr:hypothetical protein [Candidatus Aminicenantes bacterium]